MPTFYAAPTLRVTLRRLATLVLPALVALAGAASRAESQTVDVIRGRVTGPENQPIEGALITVTTLSGAVSRVARTDGNGRYTVTFPGGDGDYMVNVAAIGYGARRFEIKRVVDEDILIADAKLSRSAWQLDDIRVQASRARPIRNDPPDISGTERAVNPATLAASQLGDLAAMAASLPGVLLVPGADGDPSGFSVLGLSPDQNATTLNGQNFNGANLPPDAQVSAGLVTSPYDVSRGGFSGANFNIRTRSGTNFKRRLNSLNLDSPATQWTDAAARALGQEYTNVAFGGLVSGPMQYNRSFYNVAYSLGRRSNDLQTLLNTDPVGLLAAGIAADSVTRLVEILQQLRIPATAGRPLNNRLSDQGSLLGVFDLAPPASRAGSAYNLALNGSWNRIAPVTSPLGVGMAELPARSGDRTNWAAGAQARHSTYFSFGILSETTVGLNRAQNQSSPFLVMPNGTVRVNSTFADAPNGVKLVAFGGSPSLNTRQSTASVQFANQLSWFSENNKHRVKLSTEVRRDSYTLDQSVNQLGSFSFNSLADLEASQPGSFTRTLSPRKRSGSQVVGAISLGDSYRRTNNLQIQYGVRVDGNVFSSAPARNPQLEQLFGVPNDAVPDRLYVSPRVGFSYTYGTAAQIGGFEGAFRGPRAVVRGGIGVFQGTPAAQLIGQAIDNTGLPGALQQVNCVGAATPVPDWIDYQQNEQTIPTQCADGTSGTVFASTVPNVTLFSKDYRAPRSVRGNLNWSGAILNNRFNAQVDATYSVNLNQPGYVDLNFAPTTRFTLAAEGARPVFVQPTSIDSSTGLIASRDARVSPLYNRVTESRSDLRSETKQFRVSLSPLSFNGTWSWSLSYVYSSVRDRVRGFNTNTVGNPFDLEWARGNFDLRHQLQYSLFYNVFDFVRVNWTGRFSSGLPFTPLVSGDVNGDGYSNDRAFVYDPRTAGDPALATAMQSLLAGAPGKVRGCLEKQLGALAARNSCEAPWTASANLSISFNTLKLGLPQRGQLSFSVQNPLGAADLLLHGAKNLRGWGQNPFPDQTLLYVRGFDQATQRYRYDVNQRFGSTNPAFQPFRTPVVVTAMFRFDVGPTREEQSLVQQLNLGRRSEGNKLPEGLFRAIYGTGGGLVNPVATVLRQADTLNLSAKQADSLASLNRFYVVRLDSIWSPIAKYLGELPDRYDQRAAYARYKRGREATVDLLKRLAPDVKGLLSEQQRRKLPALVASYLDPRYLSAIRSGTAGAGGAGLFGQADHAVGTSAAIHTETIHR